jgi:hypothetical protein
LRLRHFVLASLGAAALLASSSAAVTSPPGAGSSPPPLVLSARLKATALTAGSSHTCALTSARGVKCWGWNRYGQLGESTTTERRTPVDVSGLAGGVTALAAGGPHTCALTSAGGVKCWGTNEVGQLGDGTKTRRPTPVAVVGFSGSLKCVVPNVVGKLLPKAKAGIAQAHCRIGTVTKRPSTLKKKGRVLTQKPRVGKKLTNGAKVNLTVGKGPRGKQQPRHRNDTTSIWIAQ